MNTSGTLMLADFKGILSDGRVVDVAKCAGVSLNRYWPAFLAPLGLGVADLH